jgi:hypothetical protein
MQLQIGRKIGNYCSIEATFGGSLFSMGSFNFCPDFYCQFQNCKKALTATS